MHRAGHCAFTSAEVISLIKVMLNRLNSGRWDDDSLRPAALNAAARALGSQDNAIGGIFAAQPAFAAYTPGPYPRPFPKGSTPPG